MREKIKFYGCIKPESDAQEYCVQDKITGIKEMLRVKISVCLFQETVKRINSHLIFFIGTAGDSLGYHRGMAFSTKDRDNDKSSGRHCASLYKGAWWYSDCYYSNLNGLYLHGKSSGQGMEWEHWKDNYSVKRSEMKIRSKDF